MKEIRTVTACLLAAATALVLTGCVDPAGSSSNDVTETTTQGERGDIGPSDAGESIKSAGNGFVEPAPAQLNRDAAHGGVGTEAGGTTDGDNAPADEADVNQSIDSLLGDHAAYRDIFDRLQRGVADADKAAVAALVSYPIDITIDGKSRRIRNTQEFIGSWDGILTPDITRAISTQRFGDVFVNWQGVMLGDGQVWINGICRDKDCSRSDVRVVTIQPAAQ